MALEIADYIKALVESNPPGPDPKSQGDDHLRLIKHVLKTQFASFTDGIPLTLTETILNALGASGIGSGVIASFTNPSALPAIGSIFLYAGGGAGLPGTPQAGDIMFQLVGQGGNYRVQLYLQQNGNIYMRTYNGTWQAWVPQTPLGCVQSWQVVTGSRALGTTYTNNSGRAIEVQVTAVGSGPSYLEAVVGGSTLVARAQTPSGNYGCVRFTVGPGSTYTVSGYGGTNTLSNWSELR